MKPVPTLALLATLAAVPALAQDAPPNAPNQQPAFDGQTRAPALSDVQVQQQTVISGLENPWGMALLPDGGWLITEKPGRMRLFQNGQLSEPLTGLPDVDARGQGGLLDVAVADDFAQTRRVWFSFAEPRDGGKNATAVATGTLSQDGTAIEGAKVIFQQQPAWDSDKHYGSRLVFDNDGMLFVTTGERSNMDSRPLAQDVNTHMGKVLRIDPETGRGLSTNPFANGGGQPEIWSWGHRNLQSAALDSQGRLWTVEHGAKGGDELNRPESGKNYGWPTITYGVEYSGKTIGQGLTAAEGMEQPVYYWDPVIAPSGMAFYEGEMFPEMRGDALIGGLKSSSVVRLKMEGDRVAGQQHLAEGIGRVRDVAVAPDGAIMVLTDARDGALVRLSR
ncbi:PQQ-dependent sugar dehydrogenase [Paracoccus laeviglucosivorans]|uniref:Glucose/arabinose dehydrogenase, beta-propeller fold n=1 Tax=Paracoccus laeviglucosivorans TaxID=1197861 RepID=A0A521DFW4_9RHOB|nr:PQQ-dependent sugar dehydrogenase [Paracoccus laeviglucosivorans]SMO70617.1 Glucose/arabinose dehydrogenase, beta-propeller fold [Paracoccus laeviglucosivorans]